MYDYDYAYDMEDCLGYYVSLFVKHDGRTDVRWEDGFDRHELHFTDETSAYDWAYRQGYRE